MYCDFYFNSKDAKVRIQICSKILMRIFIFFDVSHLLKVLKSLFLLIFWPYFVL